VIAVSPAADPRKPVYRRREVIAGGIAGATAIALGGAFWDDLFGSSPKAAKGAPPALGYGPRRAPDEFGIRLPEGFRSRLIARGERKVPGTGHTWHRASDGAATFATDDGGWILVSNSETLAGGVGAIRFGRDGQIHDAYGILKGTTSNCSGGPTPWGTWLSCEETPSGRVWETDPTGKRAAVVHPAMGVFKHEAAAVDPVHRHIYLTEDLVDGGLYRFTPARWPDLGQGALEVARVDRGGLVRWTKLRDPLARASPTRHQVPGMTRFKRAEGIWFDDGTVYVGTTTDSKVHAYDTKTERIATIYDGLVSREAPLLHVDQMTANHAGEVYVCEDLSTDEIDIGVIEPGSHAVSRFLSVTGPDHVGSELTGVTFDPSGTRMYFASQRAFGRDGLAGPGAIYEVSGPFRRRRPA
jgi:secreted PhoX family phosphatase